MTKQCKSKNCNNPIIDGKYCEYCKQRKKERREKIWGVIGSTAFLGGCVAVKKGVIKQVPIIAAKIVNVVLHR